MTTEQILVTKKCLMKIILTLEVNQLWMIKKAIVFRKVNSIEFKEVDADTDLHNFTLETIHTETVRV